jgi:uncharacterized Zn finger protein
LRGPDAVIEVIAHDLSSPYYFLEAAQVLAEAGRDSEALEWIARGEAAFERRDRRLADFAAEVHDRAGRPGMAADLSWQQFTAEPNLQDYQRLQAFSTAAGDWPERRARALELLGSLPPQTELTSAAVAWPQPAGHTVLVEVLLWEGDVDAAWAAAQHGGCRRSQWLTLARARASQHPADAIPVLQREVRWTLNGANRAAYKAAAQLAAELESYAERAGSSQDFAAWIRQVRGENLRRPALQDEFDRAKLPR